MAMYCIGDIQGCDAALADLLDRLAFTPSRDSLYVLGDLVNRGPASASVLRRLMAMDGSAFCLLGNHDIHLLAVSQGIRQMGRRDTLTELLVAPDAPLLLDWLRRQPLALYANRCLMVHAGVQPQWDVAQTLECAAEVAEHLRSGDWTRFLSEAFGNHPALWRESLHGMARWRLIINTLTRIRFLHVDGSLDFSHKRGIEEAPDDLVPWFAHPLRRTARLDNKADVGASPRFHHLNQVSRGGTALAFQIRAAQVYKNNPILPLVRQGRQTQARHQRQ